jgi:hypothetical protein
MRCDIFEEKRGLLSGLIYQAVARVMAVSRWNREAIMCCLSVPPTSLFRSIKKMA